MALKYVVGVQLQEESELSSGDHAVMLALFEHPNRCMRSTTKISMVWTPR
jgi:hypothetical protein